MSTKSIGNIVCTPSTVIPGQSVLVDVYAPDGTSYNNKETFYIGINGVPGSRQYLQFVRPGTHILSVIAKGPSGFEQETTTITVQQPTAPSFEPLPREAPLAAHLWPDIGLPLLQVRRLPQTSYQVAFSVGAMTQANGSLRLTEVAVLPPGVPQRSAAPNGTGTSEPPGTVVAQAELARLPLTQTASSTAVASLVASGEISYVPPISFVPNGSSPPTSYTWDFGDGTYLCTNVPYAEHDFEQALDPQKEYQQFHVTLSHASKSVTRTLVVYNAYAQLRKLCGVVIPSVNSDDSARKLGDGWVGIMTVNNREAIPLVLDQRRFVPISSDNNQLTVPTPVEQLPSPITIPGQSSLSIRVFAPFSLVPSDSMGFIVYYSGKSADDVSVRVAGHFDVAPQDRFTTGLRLGNIAVTYVNLNIVQNMVTQATTAAIMAPGFGVTLSDMRVAASQGTGDLNQFALARPIISNVNHVLSSPSSATALDTHPIALRLLTDFNINVSDVINNYGVPTPPPPQQGVECDPDNLPDTIPDGFVCQATSEQQQVIMPGRFMNARKGDLILSPGGVGLIGGLLRQVTPPQRYDHSGMMTRNHDQITHCTMSEERMLAYPVGTDPSNGNPAPTDGFRPDVVKYGWPGVITQTVENSILGEAFLDPETSGLPQAQQKWYTLNPFSAQATGMQLGGEWVIVAPMVVKPDPMLETSAMRQQLHLIADDAVTQTGKAHYRFYGYTDPTIAQTQRAPATGTGWAAGTFPAVCSSFIWSMMKKHDVHLQTTGATVQPSDLTPQEKAEGAKVGPSTPDGLYLYSAAERLVGANWLYNSIYNQAYAQTGWLGELLTRAADHIANEILNSFADDTTQTDDDNTTWQQTHDANAVSPDNLMFWQPPPLSFYGYAEPAIYREPRYDMVTIYRWNKVSSKGTLTGTVFFNNASLSGVAVQLYDGMTAFTDTHGNYQLQDVPFGQYVVQAQKVQPDGTYLSASTQVNIQGAKTTCNLYLQLPPDMYRTIHLTGSMYTHHTYAIGPITIKDEAATEPFYYALDVGPDRTHAEQVVSQDVEDAHSQLKIVLDWQVDKSVKVSFGFQLQDQTASNMFSVTENGWQGWHAQCSANNDDAHVDFTVANDVKQG